LKTISARVPDNVFLKLEKRKRDDKYSDKPWAEWLAFLTKGVSLIEDFEDAIGKGTRDALGKLWMENFVLNLDHIIDRKTYPKNKDVNSLGLLPKHRDSPALTVAAGPSLREHRHIELLAERGFTGTIFSCDRMLVPLLKAGIVPHYVTCVDGNRELIVKWFEDPLVDEHASRITGLFTTTAAPTAVDRFLEAGGTIRWFHGMLDSFFDLDSVTSFMNYMTGSTAVSCGGNVGSTSWTLAAYLQCNPIILIGLDLGYSQKVPFEDTAYYARFLDSGVPPEKMQVVFTEGFNPDFHTRFYQDPVFKHYRAALLEMVSVGKKTWGVETWNCTEGGSVFGTDIQGMRFKEALKRYGKKKEDDKRKMKKLEEQHQ